MNSKWEKLQLFLFYYYFDLDGYFDPKTLEWEKWKLWNKPWGKLKWEKLLSFLFWPGWIFWPQNIRIRKMREIKSKALEWEIWEKWSSFHLILIVL